MPVRKNPFPDSQDVPRNRLIVNLRADTAKPPDIRRRIMNNEDVTPKSFSKSPTL